MTNFLYSRRVLYTASVVGLLSALTAHPLSAQGVTDIVRSLNAVINPGDTQRLEDQARRNNRPAEERYWRDYRTGLETPNRSRDTGVRRDYGDRRFDPNDPRTLRSEAAINLELGHCAQKAPARPIRAQGMPEPDPLPYLPISRAFGACLPQSPCVGSSCRTVKTPLAASIL